MGKALYRAYRARKFDEVIGQEHITRTLQNALKKGRQSHAYLLTGPRGVGKTSVARILAHAVNGLPYESEQLPIDIIEIDAASNRRIDEIRDIKEKAYVAPVQAKYKVYIIDEVHMLTKESFNALLKTLEEPPQHVIFILATTEFYKLPETIVSRCIHFPFKPISEAAIISHLDKIASSEKIKIEKPALGIIASHSGGSFRDSISLLDQIRSFGTSITADDVRHALGLAPQPIINQLMESIERGDIKKLTEALENIREFGADEVAAAKQLLEALRERILAGKPLIDADYSVKLMKNLLGISSSSDPKRELELILIAAVFNNPSQRIHTPANNEAEIKPDKEPLAPAKKLPAEEPKQVTDPNNVWVAILDKLKEEDSVLCGIARMAKCNVNKDTLELSFKFAFHQKQMTQPKNLAVMNKVAKDVSGGKYRVTVSEHQAKKDTKPKTTARATDVKHKNISNIFGAGEVLES